MPTACATGASSNADTVAAARECVLGARAGLAGAPPSLGILFASPRHQLGAALRTAGEVAGVDFAACSTAGEISERGLTRGGMVAMLIAWGDARHVTALAPDLSRGASVVAEQLCSPVKGLADANAAAGRPRSASILIGDGLSPALEKLVIDLRKGCPHEQVVGGGAGDDGALVQTSVGAGMQEHPGGAVAIHVYSASPVGVGVAHGLRATSRPMMVTRADGGVVREIDGTPALEVFRRHAAKQGIVLDDSSLQDFLIQNELGTYLFDELVSVRAAIRAEPDGALLFAGEVPEGSSVCFVRGEPDELIAAASLAAAEAARGLGPAVAAGVLVFSCIGRGMLLGSRYDEEIAAVAAQFPGVPIAGFLSYGEIARTQARLATYHNDTIVVAALPA